jgi:hypothetical protein
MHPYLSTVIATERQSDLQAAAARHRLAAQAASPAALRVRVGRSVVALGERIAGCTPISGPTGSLLREGGR